tara:strand:+ start:166 stop:552 length:387 start_codon:yes stop_codon:yes gene_type:complete
MSNEPYITETETITHRRYNPDYGDDRVCTCGHAYDRHFDSYEDNRAVGCKYCQCDTFVEKAATPNEIGMYEEAIVQIAKALASDTGRELSQADMYKKIYSSGGPTNDPIWDVIYDICQKIHNERWESK